MLFCYTTFSHRAREYKHLYILYIFKMHTYTQYVLMLVFCVFKLRLFFGSLSDLCDPLHFSRSLFLCVFCYQICLKQIYLIAIALRSEFKETKINYRTCYLCFGPKRTSIRSQNGPKHTSPVWFSSFLQGIHFAIEPKRVALK